MVSWARLLKRCHEASSDIADGLSTSFGSNFQFETIVAGFLWVPGCESDWPLCGNTITSADDTVGSTAAIQSSCCLVPQQQIAEHPTLASEWIGEYFAQMRFIALENQAHWLRLAGVPIDHAGRAQ